MRRMELPREGENYKWIDLAEGRLKNGVWFGSYMDHHKLKIGNVFLTAPEAEKAFEQIKQILNHE